MMAMALADKVIADKTVLANEQAIRRLPQSAREIQALL